ncbi:MAG: hypothetical protein H6720_16330 [Sandaracinus sp.]|nr:hypothetical protein [Sandaracinus sp.]
MPVAVMESLAPESEVWVTVQVADQAGNLSGFSQPVRVDTTSRAWPSGPEGGGCSVAGMERARGLVLFALVALVAMRRRGVRGWRS